MNFFNHINIITIIIISIFLMPVLTGLLNPVSKSGIRHSLLSILNTLNFILGFLLAVSLSKAVFAEKPNGLIRFLNQYIPSVGELIFQYRHDIAAYLIALFIFTSVIVFLLELLTIPLSRNLIIPLADALSSALDKTNPKARRIFSGLWQLPRSVWMVLLLSLLLNFYATFVNNPAASDYINSSKAYQAIHKSILHPILSAESVKKVPVLVSDAFKKAAEDFTPANPGSNAEPNYWKLPAIKYFNGTTIDEAVSSNAEIDSAAKLIVGNETGDVEKARLLYHWISENIEYDDAKAAIILDNPSSVDSGSIVTYKERKGVCFDYSSLYVSMARAVGLKVRLISGLGYDGKEWVPHAWNQIYDSQEDRWINVDTTFGSSGYEYFDNPGFAATHKYDVIQAEW